MVVVAVVIELLNCSRLRRYRSMLLMLILLQLRGLLELANKIVLMLDRCLVPPSNRIQICGQLLVTTCVGVL